MNGWLVVVVVLLTLALGYFIMGRLDKFLENSFRTNKEEFEAKEPVYVMLTDGMTDEEILREIRQFRERHSHTRIILSDGKGDQLSAPMTSGKSH